MATKEWEAEYEAHRFDDEKTYEAEFEREPELVHGRPVYLGSGHSEFPCGLNGRLTVLLSDEVEDITCGECLAAEKARIARLCQPPRDLAGDALAAGLGYTHARPEQRNHAGYTTPCGIYVGREQYGSRGEPRVVTGRIGDRINCPGCLAIIGAMP